MKVKSNEGENGCNMTYSTNSIHFLKAFYFMFLSVMSLSVSVYHMSVCCLNLTEEVIRAIGAVVADSCEPPYRYWEPKPGLLQGQPVLFDH